jgi:hypothetical protein
MAINLIIILKALVLGEVKGRSYGIALLSSKK